VGRDASGPVWSCFRLHRARDWVAAVGIGSPEGVGLGKGPRSACDGSRTLVEDGPSCWVGRIETTAPLVRSDSPRRSYATGARDHVQLHDSVTTLVDITIGGGGNPVGISGFPLKVFDASHLQRNLCHTIWKSAQAHEDIFAAFTGGSCGLANLQDRDTKIVAAIHRPNRAFSIRVVGLSHCVAEVAVQRTIVVGDVLAVGQAHGFDVPIGPSLLITEGGFLTVGVGDAAPSLPAVAVFPSDTVVGRDGVDILDRLLVAVAVSQCGESSKSKLI